MGETCVSDFTQRCIVTIYNRLQKKIGPEVEQQRLGGTAARISQYREDVIQYIQTFLDWQSKTGSLIQIQRTLSLNFSSRTAL